jgi:hypothetical protein
LRKGTTASRARRLLAVCVRGRRRVALAPEGDAGGHLAAELRADGALAVQVDPDAGLAVALPLGDALGHRLLQDLPLEVRKLQVLEHDVDELVEGDLGLVVVEPGIAAGRALPGLALLPGLAHDLAGLGLAVAGADAAAFSP